jgi:Leucine-rich repeat (LRR) protein
MRYYLLVSTLILLFSCSKKNSKIETKIDLSSRKLNSIPDSVFEYKHLTELELGAKEVIFYPPLSALSEGDKDRNRIVKLSERISELKHLKVLTLNSNELKSLPNSLSNLQNLEILDLALNNDLNIVAEIPKLKSLSKLKILKIVDTKFDKNNLETIQKSLGTKVKLIYSVSDYMESYDKE